MNRRQALSRLATFAASVWTGRAAGAATMGSAAGPSIISIADDLPKDVQVTQVTGLRLISERPKLVGKNSHLDVHGRAGGDFLWRMETSAGIEGLGVGPDKPEAATALVGKNLVEFFKPSDRAVVSPLGRGDMPLWDLVAKLLGKPAYELWGARGPARVPVYDGSIYFADLLPEYESRGIARILEEIDMGLERGHRAFKAKIGRGWKWMPRAEGDRRDIEVLRAIRKHVGPDIEIYIDANNGFDLASTKRLFEEIGPLDIGWAEEMFPETVEEDLALKAFFKDHSWRTLVADGESAQGPEHFEPFIRTQSIDILQPDIKAFGLTLQLHMDELLRGTELRLAPHNWGSLVGFYMQLQLGRGISTLYRAEHDPLSSDVLVAEGYSVEDGFGIVPNAAGFGLTLNADAFATKVKPSWQVKG